MISILCLRAVLVCPFNSLLQKLEERGVEGVGGGGGGGGRGARGEGGRERKTGQREMCVPSGPKVLKKIVK